MPNVEAQNIHRCCGGVIYNNFWPKYQVFKEDGSVDEKRSELQWHIGYYGGDGRLKCCDKYKRRVSRRLTDLKRNYREIAFQLAILNRKQYEAGVHDVLLKAGFEFIRTARNRTGDDLYLYGIFSKPSRDENGKRK
jgi:hypothetical protein